MNVTLKIYAFDIPSLKKSMSNIKQKSHPAGIVPYVVVRAWQQ
jgi:hypothetical protein